MLIEMKEILFFQEETNYQPEDPDKIRAWLKRVLKNEDRQQGEINIIFCSDRYLSQLNFKYLNQDTLTDIITFDHSGSKNIISGDLFISIDRVTENASEMGVKRDDELHRVIVHGLLHLLGYDDKSSSERSAMREKEDAYLSLR